MTAPHAAILGVDHVQITIPRGMEDQGIAFYCGVLGLAQIEKPDALKGRGGFWLQAGDRAVHVGTEGGVERRATKAHIAYRVSNLSGWREKLAQHGVIIEEQVPIPGYNRFEFRDPFGNRVELIESLESV
ncbi:MAG: VOC family protein [Candidatus Hydrogenedentes bacterium]|nr:VOC family protein [Candidatus Hydrogenedentota bacterium]